MARFDDAIPVVLEHEGFDRFTNDPRDPGGATKWGVSLRALKHLPLADGDFDHDGDIDVDDIKGMTLEQATAFYRRQYWTPAYCGISDQRIATKVFDLAVNAGPSVAHRILQRALRACGRAAVTEDGIFGQETMTALEETSPSQLLVAVRAEAAGFYRALAGRRADLAPFLIGWIRRAYS